MPDINSIPASSSTARRPSTNGPSQSQQPRVATAPVSSSPTLNILPSNQQSYNQASATSLPSPPSTASTTTSMAPPPAPGQDNTGVGAGPGPIRHPRPLTAAELHQELEQEQELLVNRLTRDLQALRAAHNSSVASNTSSASASTSADQPQSSFVDTHLLSGPGFPLPSTSADRRHQRTSSSTSARSFSQIATAGSTPAPIPINHGHSGNAGSVLEAARNPRGSISMSRQNSTTSHRSASTSRNRSPHPQASASGSYTQAHGFPHPEHSATSGYFPRGHPTSNPHSAAATPGAELSPGLMPATLRYEETAFYRQELDTAKRENDALKRRIKELEKMVRERRESDASRGSAGGARIRSESTSTTASVSVSGATGVGGGGTGIAGGRREPAGRGGAGMERAFSALSITGSVGVGVPDEELQVGESAASAGLGTQESK